MEIWDTAAGIKLANFEAIVAFGGRRLVISSNGLICYTAAWTAGPEGGVSAFEASSGKRLWHRQDLEETQQLMLAASEAGVWCIPDMAPQAALLLDADSGRTIHELPGAQFIMSSANADRRFVSNRSSGVLETANAHFSLPHEKLQLAAALGDGSICVSYAKSIVRCFGNDGELIWDSPPVKNVNVIRLWYAPTLHQYVGK